jgi:hypothetical protein
MNPTLIGTLVFAGAFGGALLGMKLKSLLPAHHLHDDSKGTVQLGVGLIATMTALVLGLVTASAKSSFDEVNEMLKNTSADLLSLEDALAHYGPEADSLRSELRETLRMRIAMIWPEDGSEANIDPFALSDRIDRMWSSIRSLAPESTEQRWHADRANQLMASVTSTRWNVASGLTLSIPPPFLAILIFWIAVTFVSFGMFSPRNGTVITVMFLCALSIGAAIFLVLEMDEPFAGLIKASAEPLRYTLALFERQGA